MCNAGRRVRCPTLFAVSVHDDLDDLYDNPLGIWRDWAEDVRGHALDCGHYLPEEAPEETYAALHAFLAA